MNFDEFVDVSNEEIIGRLPDEYSRATAEIQLVKKLGSTYLGMTVRLPGQATSAMVNMNSFFDRYMNGEDMAHLLDEMSHIIQHQDNSFQIKGIDNYDTVKNNLFVRLSNYTINEDMLKSVPYRRIEDLALTCHVKVSEKHGELASVTVNRSLLNQYRFHRS